MEERREAEEPRGTEERRGGGDGAESRTQATYRRLRELIIQGGLSPGRRLVETEVAEKLGVSRTPVRSALQRLEQEGYVEVRSGEGRDRPVVAPLTKRDARELFYLMGALEGLAARGCARLEEAGRERVVRELKRVNRQLAGFGVGDADRADWFRLDTEFHGLYMEAAAGARVARLHATIHPQARRYVLAYVTMPHYESDVSVQEHRAIVAAIEAREPDWAEEAVESNWRNAEKRLRRAIEEMGERGSW